MKCSAGHEDPLKPRHQLYIDALRGWAILGVMAFHATACVPGWSGPLCRLMGSGGYGVQLFFVISAMTLFQSHASRLERDRNPYLAFFIRRIFRILPMFWVGIAFYLFWYGTGPRFFAPEGITSADVAATAFCAHGWRPEQINSVVPGGWSIAVEMNFYLLFPLIFLLSRTLSRATILFLIVLGFKIALEFAEIPDRLFPHSALVKDLHFFWLPVQLPVFVLGIMAYHMTRSQASAVERGLAYLAIALTILMVSFVGTNVFFAVVFVLLVTILSRYPHPLAVNLLTRYLGKISFSAYLTHFVVLDLIRFVIHAQNVEYHGSVPQWLHHSNSPGLVDATHWPPTVHFVVIMGALTVGTVILSTLTHYMIEQPGMDMGKKLLQRLGWSDWRGERNSLTQSGANAGSM